MKKLFVALFLLPIALVAQRNSVFTVQIGTFVNPKLEDFQLIQSLGYLYAEPFGDNFTKVYLGEFKTQEEAGRALQAVKNKGFNAFIAERSIVNHKEMIVVQFATEKVGTVINWQKYQPVGKLYALLDDPTRVKIITGAFANRTIARERAGFIRQAGYKDAFVKTVNTGLLHELTDFELGEYSTVGKLNAAVEAILEGAIPQSYEAVTTKTISENARLPNSKFTRPSIRAKVKRTAALDLQKVLKAEEYYVGSLDGLYGKGTASGFRQFEENDFQYNKYSLLASYFNQSRDNNDNSFQQKINKLLELPEFVLPQLEASEEPLAKAYRAYWSLTNGGDLKEVNALMNTAIQETFADKKLKNTPPFDFNAAYSYDNLEQLILHLRYLHAVADYAIPCWLFERHPVVSKAAFSKKSRFASFPNTKIANCKSFDSWKEIAILNTMLADLQPAALSADQLERQSALQTGRSFLYLFPEKLNKEQKKQMDNWVVDFWKTMEGSAKRNPILAKYFSTLKILFFQSQVLLEDYYMNQGFSADEAEGLALSVLNTYVEVPLTSYTH